MTDVKNPNTILIKNSFYPSGLTEGKIWKYYISNKYHIVNEVRGRDLMFAIFTSENHHVLKRSGKDTRFIRLTSNNYEKVLHPRVVTIYSTMMRSEDIAIIDLDTDNFDQGKQAAFEVYNYVREKIPFVKDVEIRFTGKTSFHIFCHLIRKIRIDETRNMLNKYLHANEDFRRNYTISYKRTRGIVNLDLSPNKYRGAFITKHSLSLIGLTCMEVPLHKLKSFKKNDARI